MQELNYKTANKCNYFKLAVDRTRPTMARAKVKIDDSQKYSNTAIVAC